MCADCQILDAFYADKRFDPATDLDSNAYRSIVLHRAVLIVRDRLRLKTFKALCSRLEVSYRTLRQWTSPAGISKKRFGGAMYRLEELLK